MSMYSGVCLCDPTAAVSLMLCVLQCTLRAFKHTHITTHAGVPALASILTVASACYFVSEKSRRIRGNRALPAGLACNLLQIAVHAIECNRAALSTLDAACQCVTALGASLSMFGDSQDAVECLLEDMNIRNNTIVKQQQQQQISANV